MNNPQRLSLEDYQYVFSRVPRLCIDLVIKSQEGILLTLRNIEPFKNEWHLPGGMLYKDEVVEDAVRRIARTETGLEVEMEGPLGYIESLKEFRGGHDSHAVSVPILVRPIGGELKTDWQATEAKYFKDIPTNINPPHKKFLESDYLERMFAMFSLNHS